MKKPIKISCYPQVLFIVLFIIGHSAPLRADTPPTDLNELSIKEILELSVKRRSKPSKDVLKGKKDNFWEAAGKRFSIGYRYVRVQFEDYLDGNDEKSNEEIQTQFNIVPAKIIQEAHLTEINYNALDNLYFSVLIPYIRQESQHISNISGFEEFTIKTSGIGDVSVLASHLFRFRRKEKHDFMLHSGISFPTGSIDEKGDTPSPGLNNQVPYTMQLGSGTYDLLIGGNYVGSSNKLKWGADIMQKFRLGRNSRGYSLGDRLLISTWIKVKPKEWLEPSFKLQSTFWGRIDGADPDLPAPGLVPVATPEFFGGSKVNALFGLKFLAPGEKLKGQAIDVEGGFPIYQYLNGPHPRENWRINIGWSWNF